jgi:hypothetical protein
LLQTASFIFLAGLLRWVLAALSRGPGREEKSVLARHFSEPVAPRHLPSSLCPVGHQVAPDTGCVELLGRVPAQINSAINKTSGATLIALKRSMNSWLPFADPTGFGSAPR